MKIIRKIKTIIKSRKGKDKQTLDDSEMEDIKSRVDKDKGED